MTTRKTLVQVFYVLALLAGYILIVSIYNIHIHVKRFDDIADKFQSHHGKALESCPIPTWHMHTSKPVKANEAWLPLLTLERRHTEVQDGGSWRPSTCRPLQRVAVLVTYRDRPIHLRIMLHHMHPFLQRQFIAYTIFIIEQTHSAHFNKGILYNIGFKEAMEAGNYDCIVLHDLDLLPEDDRIPYTCTDRPRHMMEARSKDNYKQIYFGNAGGVLSILPKHYMAINGFSNLYFGWGREDDDFGKRITSSNLTLLRIPPDVGRYKSVWHEHPAEVDMRKKDQLKKTAAARKHKDGLNTLSKGDMYDIVCKEQTKLFTWILVDIHQKAVMNSLFY